MGSHVGFDESGAAAPYGLSYRRFERVCVYDILVKHDFRCRSLVTTTHDDQAMLREPRARREGKSFVEIMGDQMSEVRFQAHVISRQFKTAFSINHQNEFATDRQEGGMGMWSEAPFARQPHARHRRAAKTGRYLGSGRIKLRPAPLDLSTERAELVSVDS